MKKGIHPHHAPVVLRDTSTGTCFVTRSTRIERYRRRCGAKGA